MIPASLHVSPRNGGTGFAVAPVFLRYPSTESGGAANTYREQWSRGGEPSSQAGSSADGGIVNRAVLFRRVLLASDAIRPPCNPFFKENPSRSVVLQDVAMACGSGLRGTLYGRREREHITRLGFLNSQIAELALAPAQLVGQLAGLGDKQCAQQRRTACVKQRRHELSRGEQKVPAHYGVPEKRSSYMCAVQNPSPIPARLASEVKLVLTLDQMTLRAKTHKGTCAE